MLARKITMRKVKEILRLSLDSRLVWEATSVTTIETAYG